MARTGRPPLTLDDPRHGTPNGYCNLQCRCDRCREAWADYIRDRRHTRKLPPPGDPRHGRYTTYQNYGCRCADCRRAQSSAYSTYKLAVSHG